MISLPKSLLRGLPLAVVLLPVAVLADPVTFFNTGVDSNGTPLAPGAADSHYTLIQSADPNGTTAVANTPNSAWMNDPAAGWITPGINGNSSAAQGLYVYEATLDLTNYDASSAVLNGCAATDDWLGIYLNRNQSKQYFTTSSYSSESCFSITGFSSGINLIDFAVYNSSQGPTGLLISNTSAYAQPAPAPTPEPESLLLLGTGALGTLSFVFRRKLHPTTPSPTHIS